MCGGPELEPEDVELFDELDSDDDEVLPSRNGQLTGSSRSSKGPNLIPTARVLALRAAQVEAAARKTAKKRRGAQVHIRKTKKKKN